MGCYDFPGETWAGDGSANKGVMGAGIVCFQGPGRNLVVRVGIEEEGVSSLRPELAVIARTLQATALEVDLLDDDNVFYLFLQKQKIDTELHINLEEGTYHKRLFRGPNTNDMKK
jgi:hypothetical protein